MTQNLIVKNDSDSEYVQFDVLLPDNYSKFTIDYLNGCCINQNYLKIGDKLKFSFSNNPIVYDKLKLHAHCVSSDGKFRENGKEYERLELDTFKYYRIKYLPIYEFWDKTSSFRLYLFNPCGELDKGKKTYVPNLIFDEPDPSVVPSHVYILRMPSEESSLECAFTGQFIIAFEPVDKIPDITITIGESINNSKQRPEDLGEYAIASNVVNSLKTNKINYNPSNYGSSWTYPIHNLQLQHRESITQPSKNKVSPLLVYAESEDNIKFIASSRTLFQQYIYNGGIYVSKIQTTPLYMSFKTFASNQLNDIETTIYTGPEQKVETYKYPVFIYDDDYGSWFNKYDNFMIKGDNLSNQKIYFYDGTASLTEITPTQFNPTSVKYLNSSWWYTGDVVTIKVLYLNGSVWEPVPDTFENVYVILKHNGNEYVSTTKPVRINFNKSNSDYKFEIVYELNGTFHRVGASFQIKTNESDDSFTYLETAEDEAALDPCLYIGGVLELDNGIATIVNNVHTGRATEALTDGYEIYEDWQDQPIQLTDFSHLNYQLNDEDLMIRETADGNGLYVTKQPLNNTLHTMAVKNGKVVTINSTQSYKGLKIKVFIPKKSYHAFVSVDFPANYCNGFFALTDSDGNVTQDLLDNKTMYYLATGHETLNVEPANIDDETFKTFNGSLNFDRSDSRITRIFSNDVTGACLNYLNDLLAAKLSRFYYESDVCTFDSFFDTSNKLIMNGNHRAIYGYYIKYNLFTGEHKTIMSTCGDMVKLIGSENLPNNCFPILSPEEQKIKTNFITYRQAIDPDHGEEYIMMDPQLFNYKYFHCYTSGTEEIPYVGYSANDSKETTIGGLSTFNVSRDVLRIQYPENNAQYKNSTDTTYKTNYIMDKTVGSAAEINRVINVMELQQLYPTNQFLNVCGMVDTLPCYRLYRNANFEQSDLTITTGGVKTLHPIYLQSVPRVFINNIIYFFDFILNTQQKNTWFNAENIYNYFHLITSSSGVPPFPNSTNLYPILRFGKLQRQIRVQIENNYPMAQFYMAESLDSAFIMNYLNNQSINDYLNIKELNESIPSPTNQSTGNEEIIYNFETSSELMSIQLFSSKYFRFFDEVENLNMVQFKMKYVDGVSIDQDLLLLYVTQNDIRNYFINPNNFINDVTVYNNLKTGKLFICKLGEFLQFSHILYLSSESFNNSLNVAIDNLSMSKYKTPFEGKFIYRNSDITQTQVTTYEETFKPNPEQRKNVYLFGVMFRFHQLSLGWSNLNNEISQQYEINRALGNRHFILTLYDEFGRRIPNKDTSQGFKNNLTIELMLETDDLTTSGQGQ